MYHYFVSYQVNTKDGQSGFGQICVVTDKEINTVEGTVALNEAVLEAGPTNTGVVVLFFHLLRVDEEEQ